ncbi:hypothetical protein A3K48_01365 [candidate division WOR-1 bacterium RIFOXYA12_FULL_52_29]|uniref:Uncharacterized protein n=1 Tax=candidate division WOR-1 bacterium RIFOXYC12_FULL_54_18 TaxID=1802584 RepID=A0A1F4T6F1_UNCSA|nr:MAG: hypothetical protein A3K44_01365 [candidate division WOR-1 bacterium RIFOXYA2_FULL_51_19]OGC17236.1 MAG: hypothetical protein A3K48_01365 [candidate division WOR-1 bacterium RIFOXYA12_FULL_52_29]OGC26096.1 MAG: hypothetical protein A3K32_01360 [candidate division WOR-1 bacterium RIFOXYB2_FULL_45_9]OGC27653.1 MAG: hypothetical protein A3K49_01365 [candidate division WOR-1 bacterium RIFOXYC12_FULL_54_18]OGC29133.1 MAG: hypothetical protein A2346_00340 [candidate division WOR-1 bacterium R
MSIKRVEAGRTSKPGRTAPSTPPSGLPPLLRASWDFLKNTAKRFSREGREEKASDREEQYIKEVVKKFR